MKQNHRMKGDERRQLILAAATTVFGDHGYEGTTTAEVAVAAGVSQPYVVRMFGTKENLFCEVLARALEIMMTAFRSALAEKSEAPIVGRLGNAYISMATERGLLLCLMHAFVLGTDQTIGHVGRKGFLAVYRFLRDEAGLSVAEAHQFLASGMLINTVMALRMPDHYGSDPDVTELLDAVFPDKIGANVVSSARLS